MGSVGRAGPSLLDSCSCLGLPSFHRYQTHQRVNGYPVTTAGCTEVVCDTGSWAANK